MVGVKIILKNNYKLRLVDAKYCQLKHNKDQLFNNYFILMRKCIKTLYNTLYKEKLGLFSLKGP
jgi:hypothetical protein